MALNLLRQEHTQQRRLRQKKLLCRLDEHALRTGLSGATSDAITLFLSFLNPGPQNPAPATQGALDIQPGCSFLNDLQGDPRIDFAAFFGMWIRCTEETRAVIRIIMALDLHHRYWGFALLWWRP